MKPLLWDAINPLTGTPFTWGDPNLRWGDPSYYLEPGDPGFVPYTTPSPNNSKSKLKAMKRQPYYPSRVADQIIWLTNFANKLAGHAATLGISTAECAAALADARWLIYVLGSWQPATKAWALACTDAAKEAQAGGGLALMALPVFTPPALPAAVGGLPAVVPVNTGALNRIFDIVQMMKQHGAFTEAIGTDLGVIGAEQTGPDFTTLRPEITATVIGSTVQIGWGWGGFGRHLDQCEIHVDRGSGWGLLAQDSTPGYTDTTPHPASPAKWRYKAIYRVDDSQVGLWSAEVSVTVGG
jgi:hypothetical protein